MLAIQGGVGGSRYFESHGAHERVECESSDGFTASTATIVCSFVQMTTATPREHAVCPLFTTAAVELRMINAAMLFLLLLIRSERIGSTSGAAGVERNKNKFQPSALHVSTTPALSWQRATPTQFASSAHLCSHLPVFGRIPHDTQSHRVFVASKVGVSCRLGAGTKARGRHRSCMAKSTG